MHRPPEPQGQLTLHTHTHTHTHTLHAHTIQDALHYLLGQQPERLQWFPWQHMVVVSSFLHTGQADLALPYLASYGTQMGTMEDAKLKISVLVANRHLLAAFEVVVRCNGQIPKLQMVSSLHFKLSCENCSCFGDTTCYQ